MAGSEESAENTGKNSAHENEDVDTAEQLMARFLHPIRKEFRVPKKRAAAEKDDHAVQAAGPTDGGEKKEGDGDDGEPETGEARDEARL